jgi:PAS domain-containing protein
MTMSRSESAPAQTGVSRLAATVAQLRREVSSAQAAADGRGVIELAKGVLVERLRCSPTEAAAQLARLAGEAGLSELELAADIINQAARDRVAELTQDFLARAGAGTDEDAAPGAGQRPSVAVRLRTAESGALAAGDTQAVAASLLAHALQPLGAVAVAVWAAGVDSSLSLAGYAGIADDEAARWHYVPPGVATPARRALEKREPVWFSSPTESGLPSVGGRELPGGGRVAVPAGTGGRIIGVLEICWAGPLEPQPPAVQRQIEALAELCAHTLETRPDPAPVASALVGTYDRGLMELIDLADGLHDPALVLRPRLDAAGRLTDFRIQHVNAQFIDPAGRPRGTLTGALLLEAYPLAAGDNGLFDKIERVYATGEPFRAERVPLTALVDQIPLQAIADISLSRIGDSVLLIWRIQDEVARLAHLLQHAQRLGRIGGFEENLLTGQITWASQLYELHGLPANATPVPLDGLSAHAHPDDEPSIGRFLRTLFHHRRPASTAFRMRRPDGIVRHIRVIAEPELGADGELRAIRGAYQDISSQHWTEVALAATRDQLAHTEQQAAEHNRLALRLQRAIMPAAHAPVKTAGLDVAVRYRPAEDEHLVGGDWYDAVALPSGEVLLCVGDVAGHGIQAATGMVVLRNALRGLAVTGSGPGQLLGWLNLVACHLTEDVTATALCALYDPATRTLRWARAGHLPPVLIRHGRAGLVPSVEGLLLGTLPEVKYEEGTLSLESGDTLIMYTDGLIERRDRSLEETLRYLTATSEARTESLDQRLDHILMHSNADTDDDTCVIGVQLA